MNIQEFQQLTQQGIVILDGATGSNFRRAGMPVGVCGELWALEHPEVVLELQRAYVDAGSQIVYAPTFSANRIGLGMHGLEGRLQELNAGLVALSKRAADGRALVAGDITTTGKILEPQGDMTYQQLLDVYKEQIQALAEAGADLIAVETMLTLEETMAALEAAQAVCGLPVMCTLTLEADGHLLYGGTAVEAVEALQEMGAAAVGLNCSVGPDQLESVVSAMKAVARVPVIAKPNAGMPTMDDQGFAHYSMSPEDFARAMKKLTWRGARIVGGCCGTDPEYIRALAQAVRS
ncbi:MAG: homocysteine S-methyltransferase family protein [Candidatus Faecivicinus sp.]